jgi:hypothetical protein
METASLGSVAWMDTTVNFADADRGIGRVLTLDLLVAAIPPYCGQTLQLSCCRAARFVINVAKRVAQGVCCGQVPRISGKGVDHGKDRNQREISRGIRL